MDVFIRFLNFTTLTNKQKYNSLKAPQPDFCILSKSIKHTAHY